jgi:hypothetical protein
VTVGLRPRTLPDPPQLAAPEGRGDGYQHPLSGAGARRQGALSLRPLPTTDIGMSKRPAPTVASGARSKRAKQDAIAAAAAQQPATPGSHSMAARR